MTLGKFLSLDLIKPIIMHDSASMSQTANHQLDEIKVSVASVKEIMDMCFK